MREGRKETRIRKLATGRDIIMYILDNKLEDKIILENGKLQLPNVMTVEEAAALYETGIETMKTLVCDMRAIYSDYTCYKICTEIIDAFYLGDQLYVRIEKSAPRACRNGGVFNG